MLRFKGSRKRLSVACGPVAPYRFRIVVDPRAEEFEDQPWGKARWFEFLGTGSVWSLKPRHRNCSIHHVESRRGMLGVSVSGPSLVYVDMASNIPTRAEAMSTTLAPIVKV